MTHSSLIILYNLIYLVPWVLQFLNYSSLRNSGFFIIKKILNLKHFSIVIKTALNIIKYSKCLYLLSISLIYCVVYIIYFEKIYKSVS